MANKPIKTYQPDMVKMCVPGALRKCECGATLKSELDVQLHKCDPDASPIESPLHIAAEEWGLGFYW